MAGTIWGIDPAGFVLICTASALLISRRVVTGVALRHKIDTVKRQHHKPGGTTSSEPSVSDRTLLMTVAAGWAVVAVAVASASVAGLVDIVGTVSALLGGSNEELGYITSDQSRRLWSASKWALLAVAMRAARVAVPMAYRAGRRWLAERQAASTATETLQDASPAPAGKSKNR